MLNYIKKIFFSNKKEELYFENKSIQIATTLVSSPILESVNKTPQPYINYAEEEMFNKQINKKNNNNIYKQNLSYNTKSSDGKDYSVKTKKRKNYIELDDGDGGSYSAYVSDEEYAYHYNP